MRTTPSNLKAQRQEACETCRRELSELLAANALTPYFRPVAALDECGIYGHIASVKGPLDGPLRSERRLFAAAQSFGLLAELAQLYLDRILGRFAELESEGRLLIAIDPALLEPFARKLPTWLERSLAHADLAPDRVVAIHPGISCGADETKFRSAIDLATALRRCGVGLAAADLECCPSGDTLWSAIPIELAILVDHKIEGLDAERIHGSRLQAHLQAESMRGRKVLALGVDSLGALRAAQTLGVGLVAGDFIGKAHAAPTRTFSAAAAKAIRESCSCSPPQRLASRHLLERLLVKVPPIPPETTAEQVFAMFESDPDLRAIAVVRDHHPVGLIARYHLVDNMARPFRLEVYGKKPCTRFMDVEPLTMDIRLSLPQLAELVVQADPRHLISGFIMTEGGRYVGMGTVQDLVREITSMQMEAARYANPLTQLPGNVPINQHLDQLLTAREACTVCYGDLDHFKPFNDVYGYAKGDEVILLTGRILAEVCDAGRDFIGHLGGDDFVLIFRSPDWEARCRRALQRFEDEIVAFFSHDDVERGGYVTENRKGEMEFHALTTLSIGAAAAPPGVFPNHLAIAAVAAEVKKKAKAIRGNSLYINQRIYGQPGA